MPFQQSVSLASYSTMGLGGPASYLTDINDKSEIAPALEWARQQNLPVIMIGGGSNIVWRDEGFPGLVLVNKIMGYELHDEDDDSVSITIGAGENWDSVVERSVSAGLTGIEALSLIPGTAGGTPIQNVGAYGQEISSTLTVVEAYDSQASQLVNIPGSDCAFSYRDSRFKSADRGRFFVTGLTLRLAKGNPQPPFYGQVQAFFEEKGINNPTPADLREAVVTIRSNKLPDPVHVKNNGSFFGNPIVPAAQFEELRDKYATLPSWPLEDGRVKLSAAWLIEQAGFKDYHDQTTGMSTWPKQPLVLVNESAKTTADLLAFKQKLVESVRTKFGITLVQEPELLP